MSNGGVLRQLIEALFNPIVPLYLQQERWQIIDCVTIVAIVVAAVVFSRDNAPVLARPVLCFHWGGVSAADLFDLSFHDFTFFANLC